MESVFLGCFLFGFLLVLASVVMGFAHMALPGGHHAFHIGHGTHAATHGHGGDGGRGLPLWNVSSVLAFLMWFGAAGYTFLQVSDLTPWLALVPAVGFGIGGGALVSWFLGVVMRGESTMDPVQYELEGTIARITVGIPAGGTGEIVFTKGLSRRSEGARSLDGTPVPRGEEVVVVDYQRGIALVQTWADFVSNGGREAQMAPLPAAQGASATAATPALERSEES